MEDQEAVTGNVKKVLTDSEVLEFVALVREWSEACLQVLDRERLLLSERSRYGSPAVPQSRADVQP